jgi:hypothetical protein
MHASILVAFAVTLPSQVSDEARLKGTWFRYEQGTGGDHFDYASVSFSNDPKNNAVHVAVGRATKRKDGRGEDVTSEVTHYGHFRVAERPKGRMRIAMDVYAIGAQSDLAGPSDLKVLDPTIELTLEATDQPGVVRAWHDSDHLPKIWEAGEENALLMREKTDKGIAKYLATAPPERRGLTDAERAEVRKRVAGSLAEIAGADRQSVERDLDWRKKLSSEWDYVYPLQGYEGESKRMLSVMLTEGSSGLDHVHFQSITATEDGGVTSYTNNSYLGDYELKETPDGADLVCLFRSYKFFVASSKDRKWQEKSWGRKPEYVPGDYVVIHFNRTSDPKQLKVQFETRRRPADPNAPKLTLEQIAADSQKTRISRLFADYLGETFMLKLSED